MDKNYDELIGKTFGDLTVISRVENTVKSDNHIYLLCQCSCGSDPFPVRKGRLVNGYVTKCKKCRHTTHGETKTRLYNIWTHMIQRCYNQNNDNYKHYGERGIIVCDEWRNSYEKFRDWAFNNGYSDNLTIDRINVDGNYEPDNCKWATRKEQANNKRNNHYITYNGETHTLMEWSNIIGIEYHILSERIIHSNWTIDKAFTESIRLCGEGVDL